MTPETKATQNVDQLTRELTMAESFQDLLDGGAPGYVPSIYGSKRARQLADAYDEAQAARGDSRRAFRGY